MPIVNLIATPVFPSKVIPKGATKIGTRRVFSEDLDQCPRLTCSRDHAAL